MSEHLTQNDLYELVADFGECVGMGLPRTSHLLRGVDHPQNWLHLSNQIGADRAKLLSEGLAHATNEEITALVTWQVENALLALDPDIMPALWLCRSDDGRVLLIEGWGDAIDVELIFRFIGSYPAREQALDDLNRLYVMGGDEF